MDHFKRARDHQASQLRLQQLLILFILFIHVPKCSQPVQRDLVPAPERPLGSVVSLSNDPPRPGGRHPLGARASRPHPVPLAAAELPCDAAGSHPAGGNSIGQAEGEPWRRSRLIQVGEMAEAVPGLVRAGRPRSQEAIIP